MKRLLPIAVLTATLLTACASLPGYSDTSAVASSPAPAMASHKQSANSPRNAIQIQDGAGGVTVQTVEFQPGVSSASVERLARRFGCTGSNGAGLVTEKGPVEVYRMRCDNGTTFIAQCELRQCRPMR
ncbi:hypothetical protein D3871_06015 [Noviherbaspirillum saxi]|uniref:Lipoprotein n=2 Tax=Noviherbaspirillum saxi TaxID=2320863 RepID=A0A3A3FUB6_9BURK|nr:hypothetical protein D3871_06015 [Noviherbaspirillum saxi]